MRYASQVLDFATCNVARLRRKPSYYGVFLIAIRTALELLPPSLPGASATDHDRDIPFQRGSVRARRPQARLALPPGSRTIQPRLARHAGFGGPRADVDWRGG